MPLHRVPAARGPVYLPEPPDEPEIASAMPTAFALILAGAALIALGLLLGGWS